MYQPFAGGWRYGDRPTSVEALYQPKPIDNDFLRKVASLGQDPEKKGLLEQALTATPLQGLLDAPGSAGWGNDQDRGGGNGPTQASGGYVQGPDGNTYAQTSPGGLSFGFNPSKMNPAMLAMNPLGALASGVTMKRTPENYALQFMGAPNASVADMLSAYGAQNGLLGDVSFGGGGDFGLGASLGGAGPSLGNEAGLGLGGDIGDGFGFGGLGDW